MASTMVAGLEGAHCTNQDTLTGPKGLAGLEGAHVLIKAL